MGKTEQKANISEPPASRLERKEAAFSYSGPKNASRNTGIDPTLQLRKKELQTKSLSTQKSLSAQVSENAMPRHPQKRPKYLKDKPNE